MRVHHLDLGTMCPVARRLVNPERRLVCHGLLIETADRLVLVESGFGTADVADPKPRLGRPFVAIARPRLDPASTAIAQVTALGFDPADVRDIALTHLDLDHAGGISDFPHARIHVAPREMAAALAQATRVHRDRFRAPHFAHGPLWAATTGTDGDWHGFDGVSEIVDGVIAVPLPGHSPGHQGIAVRTGDRWLLHAGDAFFHRDEMRPDDPRCSVALRVFQRLAAEDNRPRLATQERLRDLVRTHDDVSVFCAHDPRQLSEAASASA